MSIAEKPTPQAVRNARAAAADFQISKHYWNCRINGQATKVGVIHVRSGEKVYFVTPGQHRPQCNCGDFVNRCAGTTLECKHIVAAREWSRQQKAQG